MIFEQPFLISYWGVMDLFPNIDLSPQVNTNTTVRLHHMGEYNQSQRFKIPM